MSKACALDVHFFPPSFEQSNSSFLFIIFLFIRYGEHGFEMINVTYSGDTLVAYKVTGDANIPRGEISFTADLSTNNPNLPHGPTSLDPILLSEASSKKWGTKRLPRFPGHGHAAEPGFLNHQFMEGQLVVIGEGNYFSFAWVPLEHQIFFGRYVSCFCLFSITITYIISNTCTS